MKIKIAILEKNLSYLNRIVSTFNLKYADKIEVYSFTEYNVAMAALNDSKIDILMADDGFVVEEERLPRRCSLVYFVDSPDIDKVRNQYAICKFQKIDLIYKQILSVYSENTENKTRKKKDKGECGIIAFMSPGGGVGSSSMAAACALFFARKGKRVFYLNLEKFGSSDLFFSGEGQYGISDVIFALKSKKANLSMKLESCVKKDSRGVFFFSQPQNALDLTELSTEELCQLISELKATGLYEYIILDLDFNMNLKFLDVVHAVVVTSDGSERVNLKIVKACNALAVLGQAGNISIMERIFVIYNKFSSKRGIMMGNIGLQTIGGAPRYVNATVEQVLEQLSSMTMFENIL